MAQTVVLIDDLDGTVAVRTYRYILDGKVYDIDLNAENIALLESAMAPFVEASRTPVVKAGGSGKGADKERLSAIREWAKANGVEVSERGRISAATVEAFDRAHAADSEEDSE